LNRQGTAGCGKTFARLVRPDGRTRWQVPVSSARSSRKQTETWRCQPNRT